MQMNEHSIEPQIYAALTTGPAYPFKNKFPDTLPMACFGVYTIWRGEELIYVGIAGRKLDMNAPHKGMKGIRDRLDSHQRGRRAGSQFGVYVCDRLVLPGLTINEVLQIAEGKLNLDQKTREYIQAHLAFRFVEVATYSDAMAIETAFTKGHTAIGKPLLNPYRMRTGNGTSSRAHV